MSVYVLRRYWFVEYSYSVGGVRVGKEWRLSVPWFSTPDGRGALGHYPKRRRLCPRHPDSPTPGLRPLLGVRQTLVLVTCYRSNSLTQPSRVTSLFLPLKSDSLTQPWTLVCRRVTSLFLPRGRTSCRQTPDDTRNWFFYFPR